METSELFPAGRVNGIAAALLAALEKAVGELDAVNATHREKVKTETGETFLEYQQRIPRKKGNVDRQGLKQLTGVLKDLEEILLNIPQLDAAEQQARLDKLRSELQQEDSRELTVILEGEAADYAG